MLGKQTPVQKGRGTAKGVLRAAEAERSSSPTLQLATFPLLFLGHPLSPRYPKRVAVHSNDTSNRGQKRSVESNAGTPFSHPDTSQISVDSRGRSQKKKKERNTHTHTHTHTLKTQNKLFYSIFYSVTIS